jgi:nucleoid-associated protein YgaU
MEVAKLTIRPEEQSVAPGEALAAVEAMFNPNSYTITKNVTWNSANDARANAPSISFGGGGARQLSLELFFDVTELPGSDKDVRNATWPLVRFTHIMRDKAKPRPPVCTIDWDGATQKDFPFTGVVSTLTQKFTLFHSTGRPLRATVDVTFIEFLSRNDDLLKTDPELTTRTVRRGDDISRLAAELYGDATAWRVIAEANRLKNPLQLIVGSILTIPKR